MAYWKSLLVESVLAAPHPIPRKERSPRACFNGAGAGEGRVDVSARWIPRSGPRATRLNEAEAKASLSPVLMQVRRESHDLPRPHEPRLSRPPRPAQLPWTAPAAGVPCVPPTSPPPADSWLLPTHPSTPRPPGTHAGCSRLRTGFAITVPPDAEGRAGGSTCDPSVCWRNKYQAPVPSVFPLFCPNPDTTGLSAAVWDGREFRASYASPVPVCEPGRGRVCWRGR